MLHASPVSLRLSDPVIELVAARFRVLSEPTRIRLLDRLRDGDATVHELHEAIGGTQQNVSKHLGVLHSAGLVTRTKHGTSARYAIADDGVFALCDRVCGGLRKQAADLDALLHSRGLR
jgi:DNA-binding transcriptional ArsR family regulator